MCDQTEVSYLENDVVWVKIGPIWWPGVVKDLEKDEEGKGILARLKKKPIAVVKFFQEDNYEFVKNLDQIYHYSCRRKDEFIKKGLDKFRNGAPHMKKFPADVTTAEKLTNGDLNIINDPKFLPEKKESYSEIFGSGKKKSRKDFELSPRGKARILSASSTPYRPITHQRFINKVLHGESDHRVKTLIQLNSGSDDGISRNPYKCHICKFETSRVNVVVAHHRYSHSSKNAITWSGSDCKLVRKKHVYKSRKIKSKKLEISRDDYSDESEESGKKKSPKSKFFKAKTKANEKDEVNVFLSTLTKRKSKEQTPEKFSSKKPRFTDVLLADWDEDEDEDKDKDKKEDKIQNEINIAPEESESKNENVCSSVAFIEKTDNSEPAKNQNEKMSCFDFDEEEEGFIGMSNANTYGRKIPRVIPVKDKTELGMDLEIEELFKKKNESEGTISNKNEDSNSKITSTLDVDVNLINEKNQEEEEEEESTEKPAKGPGKRRRSKSSKEEELKVVPEDSLALRRTRRPGAKKSYLNEIIEKIEDPDMQSENEPRDEEKFEIEKKVVKIVKEETGSSSRRKQDFKQFTMDGDRDEIIYSNVINVERKPKTSEPEKKKTKSLGKDARKNTEDLTTQIGNLLEETKLPTMPELSDSPVDQTGKLEDQKSENFSFDCLAAEQSEKKIAKITKEVKSISRMFSDSIPNAENSSEQAMDSSSPQSSQEEKSAHDDTPGKVLNLKHSSTAAKRGSIVLSSTSKTSETPLGKLKVLPVMRQSSGKDCIILPPGKKLKYVEESDKSEEAEASQVPKNIKAIKVKSDSLPPSLISGGKLKGQTIIHQKGGKYVIVTQSPSLARQKATSGKVQSGSKVVILTNQLGEQKIITAGGLQQTKFKVEGQKLVAPSDSITDKDDSTSSSTGQSQPMIKMVPDGKGGIMKQLTVSPKKLLLGGTKVLVSGSGSTFSTGNSVQKITLSSSGNVARTGGDFRLIENYKGSGKMVLIPENACAGSGVVLKSASGLPRQITKVIQTPQAVQSVKKKPKILMRASTSQGEFVTQAADSPAFVVKQKGADGKFSTQKILRTEIVNQPKPATSGTKTFFIAGQGSNKKGESYIITTNESVAGKVIRMRQKVKEVDASCSKAGNKIQKVPEMYTISQNSLLVPNQTTPIEGETSQIVQLQDQNQQSVLQTQVIAMPGPVGADGNQTYVLVSVDENGIVQGVDNSVVAYDTATQSNSIFVNPTSSNNVILINPQSTEGVTPAYSSSSQDILAEALANTNVLEGTINNEMDSVVPSILLPPSIPSSVVQETSITLQKPIMTPLEMPSSVTPDTSGLEPPPLPPTPTEEDVLMEDSETAGVINQEQGREQNEIENNSNNIEAYLEPETFDAGNSTRPLQIEDVTNQKVFEEEKTDGERVKKTPEYFQSELNLNTNEQEEYKKLPREELVLENSQEQTTHSFQSLPVLSDEPDTSDAPIGEPIVTQQFDVEKSRVDSEQFSNLLREQEPPSSTNNEILLENHRNGFQEFKYEKHSHMRESENSEEPKSKEPEDKIMEESLEAEKESNENRESMPVITDESNINAFELDSMYSEVISQKRFQEETEVSSTTDEFSNKDVAN